MEEAAEDAAAAGAEAGPATARGADVLDSAPLAIQAAPRATACLGCASTATGRPSSAPTSWATIGIRDEPPTSSTACKLLGR